MNQIIKGLTFLLLLILPQSNLLAQMQKGELSMGEMISSEITPNEKHRYSIDLEKHQFSFFRLLQKEVDVMITTYDSEGEKMKEFDSPNGKNGFELFSIISTKKGKYVLEVSIIEGDGSSGLYDLTVEMVKPKATMPNERVDEVFAPWDSNLTPGAAVAIVKDGAIVYKKGYGLANLEYEIPITPNSIFHIASVSKQFTVFSILLLEKEGKLSLNDDIRKYIPEVPDFGKTITLRHLASHTSGLRDQWNLLSMAGWRMDDVITKEHVLKLVAKQKELNFDPGEEFAYCNTGFTLLAEVVSRVSEMSFAEFAKANIFEPLEMTNTLFYDDHEKIVKNRAYSYYSDGEGFKKSNLNYANVGATSLFTTVEDLSLWSMNFSNVKVGTSDMISKMNEPAKLNNGKPIGGALGQFVGEYKGLKEIQHGGADAGYRSFLTRFPDENFAVIVFSNSAEFNSGQMAHEVVDIYLKDKITKEAKIEDTQKKGKLEEIVVAQNILKTYLGIFEVVPGFTIEISENNGKLFAQATGQPLVTLTPLSETEFDVGGVEAKLEFIPNDGKNINSIKLYQGGQETVAPRLAEFDTNSVNLSDFSGAYHSEELTTTYHFTVVDDQLVAKHSRLSDFNLNPIKKDVFSGEAWFFGQVDFVRDGSGEITGCKVTNGRVRNLYFEKVK